MSNEESLKRKAFQFIILFGFISAFGDMAYESARSVTGPYLYSLGASSVVIGIVTGVGEFLGYGLRIVSGLWVDRKQSYWVFTYIGYALLLSVPLLAFTHHWQLAALLFILERVGKAIRSPAKDTMLSFAAKRVGTGIGFGIHGAIDQFGGFIGPFLLMLSFGTTGSYKNGFLWTAIPVVLLLLVLTYLRFKVSNPEEMETLHSEKMKINGVKYPLPASFWWYVGFSFISMAGFVGFPLLSLHMSQQHLISPTWIPGLYALAMGVDALVSLWAGLRYDRIGFKLLFWIPVLNIPVAWLGFMNYSYMVCFAAICWGTLVGIQNTVMKATIADLIPVQMRGRAYAIFNIALGLAMLIGSSLMGWMYEMAKSILISYVLIAQLIAFVLYFKVKRIL